MTTAAVYPGPLRLLAAAKECPCMTTGELAVLVVLALRADNETGICDPAVSTIAAGAKMSDRGTRLAIASLEAAGWLSVERRFASESRAAIPHQYRLRIPSDERSARPLRVLTDFPMTAADRSTWIRDDGACRYCGARGDSTFDHVIPRCQGGSDEPENLVVACRGCNSRKGGRTPEQAGMVLRPAPQRHKAGSVEA